MIARCFALALAIDAVAAAAAESARPREFWTAIAEHDYAVPAGAGPFDLLVEMNELLRSTDPVLRDQVAYGAVARWVYPSACSRSPSSDSWSSSGAATSRPASARGTDSVLLSSFSALDLSLDGAALEDRLGAFPEQHRQVWAEAPAIDVSRYIAVQNVKAVLRAAHAALAMDSDLAAAAVQARSKLLETLGRVR